MTTREEIVVRAGFDNTALARGLRSAGQQIKEWVSGIVGMIGTGMMIAGFNKVLEKVDAINNAAKQTGFSTEGIQKFQYAVHQLGLNAGTANYALMYLAKNIGEASNGAGKSASRIKQIFQHWGIDYRGKSTEQVFYDILDAMQKMTDPAQKSAMAMDLMSTDGIQLLPILEQGRKAFEAMSAHAPLFSEDDIKNLEEAKKTVADMEDRLLVWAGKFLATIGEVAKRLGSVGIYGPNTSNLPQGMTDVDLAKAVRKKELAYESNFEKIYGRKFDPGRDPWGQARLANFSQQAMDEFTKSHPVGKSVPSALGANIPLDQFNQALAAMLGGSSGLHGMTLYNELLRERGKLYSALNVVQDDAMEKAKITAALQENQNKLTETYNSALKEQADAQTKANDLMREKERLQTEDKFNFIQAHAGGNIPSLEDMANATAYGRGLTAQYFHGGRFDMMRNSPFLRIATDLKRLQLQYAWNVLHPGVNPDSFVQNQAKQIDALKGQFAKAGIISPEDVYKKQMESMTKNGEAIDALRRLVTTDGLKVIIPSN